MAASNCANVECGAFFTDEGVAKFHNCERFIAYRDDVDDHTPSRLDLLATSVGVSGVWLRDYLRTEIARRQLGMS